MNVFKRGDIVVAIRTSAFGTIRKGNLYLVLSTDREHSCRVRRIHDGPSFYWENSMFTLVDDLTELEKSLI